MKSTNTISADREWISRCEDFEQSVLRYKSVRFSRFVTPHELAVFRNHVKLSPFVNAMVYGGSADCERVMIGFFPDYMEPDEDAFPITPLSIRGVSGLTHRDILGSVLGLGIKRELTGDIYVNGDEAVIMCDSSISEFLLYQLKTVGRSKVEVAECPKDIAVSLEHPFSVSRFVVASLRLDAVVGAAAHISRSEAQTLIAGECVQVNFSITADTSKKLKEGDVLSIRHHGRFVLQEVTGETKKGRLAVQIKKYI